MTDQETDSIITKIKIYRGEIFDAIAAENKQAAVPNDLLELDMLKALQI